MRFAVLCAAVGIAAAVTSAWAQDAPTAPRFGVQTRADAPSQQPFESSLYELPELRGQAPTIIQVPLTQDEEEPILLPVRNIYQKHEAYADLNGGEMLCGAAAISNAIYYLRYYHRPSFPRIAKQALPHGWNDIDMVRDAVIVCNVDKESGVSARELYRCGGRYMERGGYDIHLSWMIAPFAASTPLQHTPQPEELRALIDDGAAVIVLLGWFGLQDDQYVRYGGHFVMLAGYDASDPSRFYVSDPLVNYVANAGDSDQNTANVSAFVLEQVDDSYGFAYIEDDGSVQPMSMGDRTVWQTRDRFTSILGVVQGAIVLGRAESQAAALPN